MSLARRIWLPMVLLAAGVAGLGVLAFELIVDGGAPRLDTASAREPRLGEPVAAESAEASVGREDGSIDRPDALAVREIVREDRLAPISASEARRREQSGRATFFGVVRAPDGKPCPGARIFHDGEPAATTDGAGAYRIEVVHDVLADGSEAGTLAALKEGVGVASVRLEGPTRRIDLVLEPGALVRGRTVERDHGRFIAGATVELLARSGFANERQFAFAAVAKSKDDGSYSIGQVPVGSFELRAHAPGFTTNGFRSQLAAENGRLTAIDLLLAPACTVRGWFDPWPPPWIEQPEKAEVRAWTVEPRNRKFDQRGAAAKVEESGRFAIEAPGLEEIRMALARGDEAYWSDALDASDEGGVIELGRVQLEPAAMIVGRLDVPPEVAELGFEIHGKHCAGAGEIEFGRPLGSDGSFRVGPFPAGVVQFSIGRGGVEIFDTKPAGFGRSAEMIALEAGTTIDLGTCAPSMGVLCGRVVDETGAPIAFAHVSLKIVHPNAEYDAGSESRTDVDGRYCLAERLDPFKEEEQRRQIDFAILRELARMKLFARVTARGRGPQLVPVTFPGAHAARREDLVMPAGRALAGTIVDLDGTPLVGAVIEIERVSGDEYGILDVTEADGSFAFQGLDDASYRFVARRRDGEEFRFGVVTTQTAPLRLLLREAIDHVPLLGNAAGR